VERTVLEVNFQRAGDILIYFDRPTQDRVVDVLARLLGEQGLLFVGPSETGLLLSHGFVSTKLPLAFAFRKAPAAARDTTPITVHRAKRSPFVSPPAHPVTAPQPLRRIPSKAAGIPPAIAPPKIITGIDQAERLANQGHLAEAGQCCEAHLRAHGPSAKAFHLLGVIRDASGHPVEAADSYRKALYLDPDHHEALVHLAFLLHKRGDVAGAQVLQQRAHRLQLKGKKQHARVAD
ncbi:MAG: methyltransferase, partial [Burkholderiales bacterium]